MYRSLGSTELTLLKEGLATAIIIKKYIKEYTQIRSENNSIDDKIEAYISLITKAMNLNSELMANNIYGFVYSINEHMNKHLIKNDLANYDNDLSLVNFFELYDPNLTENVFNSYTSCTKEIFMSIFNNCVCYDFEELCERYAKKREIDDKYIFNKIAKYFKSNSYYSYIIEYFFNGSSCNEGTELEDLFVGGSREEGMEFEDILCELELSYNLLFVKIPNYSISDEIRNIIVDIYSTFIDINTELISVENINNDAYLFLPDVGIDYSVRTLLYISLYEYKKSRDILYI